MVDIPERVIQILACPDCRDSVYLKNKRRLSCRGCEREFEILDNNIISMRPQKVTKLPEVYFDPEYLEARERVEEIFEHIYDSDTLVSNINNSYHITQESFLSKYYEGDPVIVDLCCGVGTHLKYVSPKEQGLRVGLDENLELLQICKKSFPQSILVWGDIYRAPFKTGSLKYVLCLAALEHIYYLNDALEEVERMLFRDGLFFVSIPTEGGFMWNFGRSITTQRVMEKKGIKYKKYIEVEHCNTAKIVLKALHKNFEAKVQNYYPFKLPSINFNLLVNGVYVKKN